MSQWLPTLSTEPPQAGCELAIKLARVAIRLTQPDAEACEWMQPDDAEDSDALIAASHVAATHFATLAAANAHWRDTP